MFNIILEVAITAGNESKRFIEMPEIELGANPYWHSVVECESKINCFLHQPLPNTGLPVFWGSYDTTDRRFTIGNSRRHNSRIGDKDSIGPAHQVKAKEIFIISILEYTVLFHHEHFITQLHYGI